MLAGEQMSFQRNFNICKVAFVALATLLLLSYLHAQTCTGGLAGSNLQDCIGTESSPCHKCDVNGMQYEIRAPDDVTTTGWQNMSYSSEVGTCSTNCTQETWVASPGYNFCPQEGAYDIRVRASAQNQSSYDWEVSDWSIAAYTVNYDLEQKWCSCKGGIWLPNATYCGSLGCSGGKCCGDDGTSDNFCEPGGGSCVAGTYHANHCSDNVKNCDEQEVDCGGADCAPCVTVVVLNPNGNQYISGTHGIDFNVYGKSNEEIHAKIAYSTSPGSFSHIIQSDLNLNNYPNIANLSCTGTNWPRTEKCTYLWNTTIVPDGNYYIDINVWRLAGGNYADSSNSSFYIDNTPPATTDNAPSGWQKTDFTVTLTCSDAGSGCAATYYRLNSGSWQTYSAPISITTEGINEINYYSVDNLGNTETPKTAYAALDKTPPAIDVNSPENNQTFASSAYVKFTVNKGLGSPINLSSIRVLVDGADSDDFNKSLHCTESSGSYTCTYYEYLQFTKDYNIAIIAADSAGNVSQVDRNIYVHSEYNLEGYTIEPSTSMRSTNYSMVDVGLSNLGGTTCYGGNCIEVGFPSIFRNIPPILLYIGQEQGYISGTFEIKFYAIDYEMEELHTKIAYSTTRGAFQNIIASDLNLNNHANIAELTCTGTDWRYAQLCTYNWDTTSITDGNYYLDLNLWDIQRASDSYSTRQMLCIDNNAPGVSITTPGEDAITSDPTISFTLSHNGCAPIALSSIQVKINGSAANFDYASDCNASGLNYSCTFYQVGLAEQDYNLSIIVSDLAGNVRQLDRNFHFVPRVGVASIMPSGTLESGITTISFTVHNTMMDNLYASIYYSSINAGKLGFEHAIDTNIALDDYATNPKLECDSNIWWPAVRCTYTWDASSVPDGNYYIDINLWNASGMQAASSSVKQFLLDNTAPSASITGVSDTVVYEDIVYLRCSDSGSGCKATRWYYFSPVASCSNNKSDYNYSTTRDNITISDDHNDYICLWVENLVDLSAIALSEQLHVQRESWSITKGASETISQATVDLNNTCSFYVTADINLACEYQSFVKIREHAADINMVYEIPPAFIEASEKPITVVLESAITSFNDPRYFIKFESETSTITSQGNEQDYPNVIVRKRTIPLLRADGRLELGTLIIKAGKR